MFPGSFLAPPDFSKCELKNQGVLEDYISRLCTLLDQCISKGTAKTKLAKLAFLYCGDSLWKTLVTVNSFDSDYSKHFFVLFIHKGAVSFQCEDVPSASRVDCGFDGIEEDFCLDQDCCYDDTGNPNVPKCYYKAGKCTILFIDLSKLLCTTSYYCTVATEDETKSVILRPKWKWMGLCYT